MPRWPELPQPGIHGGSGAGVEEGLRPTSSTPTGSPSPLSARVTATLLQGGNSPCDTLFPPEADTPVPL